jgi:hypothetical protein
LNNSAPERGGGISGECCSGAITLTNSTVSNNSAERGGGVQAQGATIILTDSTVSGNSAAKGGGILSYNPGTVTVTSSTVSGNDASGGGGGLFNTGEMTLTNSTVSGNSATAGGGVFTYGPLVLTNSTVSGNSAGCGSGVWVYFYMAETTITNSILAGNPDGDNCCGGGVVIDNGNNFADDDTCGPGFAPITSGVDLDIDLADNGGPTQTHALTRWSVARDAAGECGLETDQRGLPRNDRACDSGSFEHQCSIAVRLDAGDTKIYFTGDVNYNTLVAGYLSDLLADRDFSQAECLGRYFASPAVDTLPEPSVGDGRYYIAGCSGIEYGDSSLIPDPRDDLNIFPCP